LLKKEDLINAFISRINEATAASPAASVRAVGAALFIFRGHNTARINHYAVGFAIPIAFPPFFRVRVIFRPSITAWGYG
jgi:hypothetical protein